MSRPVRPSAQRAAVAKVSRGEPVRLVFKVRPESRKALKVRAAQKEVTLRVYLLGLARADGVEIMDEDLKDGRRDEE